MENKKLTMVEKEDFVRSIVKLYSHFQEDLMVQEDNIANDFCWQVYGTLNSLDSKDKKIIIENFFKNNKSSKRNLNESEEIMNAIDRFVEKMELK